MFVVHLEFFDFVTLTVVILMAVFIFFSYCSKWIYSKSKRREKDDT